MFQLIPPSLVINRIGTNDSYRLRREIDAPVWRCSTEFVQMQTITLNATIRVVHIELNNQNIRCGFPIEAEPEWMPAFVVRYGCISSLNVSHPRTLAPITYRNMSLDSKLTLPERIHLSVSLGALLTKSVLSVLVALMKKGELPTRRTFLRIVAQNTFSTLSLRQVRALGTNTNTTITKFCTKNDVPRSTVTVPVVSPLHLHLSVRYLLRSSTSLIPALLPPRSQWTMPMDPFCSTSMAEATSQLSQLVISYSHVARRGQHPPP